MLRADLERTLTRVWYTQESKWLMHLLRPFAWLFSILAKRTWKQYEQQRALPLKVPVVIIGNIVAGGSGKTPITQALAIELTQLGVKVGIVSRGYGGQVKEAELVNPEHPKRYGDEPCLLAATTQCPVAIARIRSEAVDLLCKHFTLDLILSDDGLQHASLYRDFEICVIGPRGFGNGHLLPAGPLREPISRLQTVNAILTWSKPSTELPTQAPIWQIYGTHSPLQLLSGHPAPEGTLQSLAKLQEKDQTLLLAAAGLAQPERFYVSLAGAGLKFKTLAVADHGMLSQAQLKRIPERALLIITEKDAVKLRHAKLPAQLQKRIRIVPWRITIPQPLLNTVVKLLKPH